MKSQEKILNKNDEGKFICVGLDTDINKIPSNLRKDPDGVFKFNYARIELHANTFCLYSYFDFGRSRF